eukprot:scaffold57796_cov53-Attheya_sp.AAC.1
MGAGKTEQISVMLYQLRINGGGAHVHVDELPSVCVVSFRVLLAMQQATRLGMSCYTDVGKDDEMPNWIVICLNSLLRLGDKTYDYVILDE